LIFKYLITVMKNTAAGCGDVFYCHIFHVFNPFDQALSHLHFAIDTMIKCHRYLYFAIDTMIKCHRYLYFAIDTSISFSQNVG
ncbi:MAG: hypothetical protein VZR73_16525, partial [Acutalibacteraceae bacterium]|nr:hypothetical protein [Acutalibacteraceae bacterium]